MMEKNPFIKILVEVRQGQLSDGQALNRIKDVFIQNRDGPDNLRFWPKGFWPKGVKWPEQVNEELLSVLEQVRMKTWITTNEAE